MRLSRSLLVTAVALGGCGGRSPFLMPAGSTPAPASGHKGGPPAGLDRAALAVGDRAPAVNLPTDTGTEWTLAEAVTRGPVVVVFYRGDWCPFCRKQLAALQDRFGELTAKHASIVAISVDPPDRSRALAARLDLGFPILSDEGRVVIRQWGVEDAESGLAWPSVFIVGPDGAIAARWLSESVEVRPTTDEVIAGVP